MITTSLTCSRVVVTSSTAAAQSTAATVQGGREVAKARVAAPPKKPETVNVGQFLKAGLPPRIVSPPNRQIPWDDVFAPQTDDPAVEWDVTPAAPVFVDPAEPIETRYEFKGELGRGSYGTVYHATEISTGREVAIKEIRRSEGCSILSDCKLQQEIDVLEDLRECPSVVQLQGSHHEDDTVYIVTELCKGGDMEGYLKTNGPLNERQMAMVAAEALKMLSDCHSKKIVHGDVKAANFVIANRVEYHMFKHGTNLLPDGWLKGIDFGTSQYTGKGRCSNKVGTPTHWAPEVFAGSYHTEADMWSLGVTLFRLMTGRHPFWDIHEEAQLKSERDVLKGVIYSTPDYTTEPWCQASPECIDFMRGLLNSNYEVRLTAEAALNHPFMARHLKKQQRFGLGMFEQVVLPSATVEAFPAAV